VLCVFVVCVCCVCVLCVCVVCVCCVCVFVFVNVCECVKGSNFGGNLLW